MKRVTACLIFILLLLAACTAGEESPRPTMVGAVPLVPSPTRMAKDQLGRVTLGDGLAALDSYRATFVLTATRFVSSTHGMVNARLTTMDEHNRLFDARRIVSIYSDTLRYQYTEQIRLGDSSFLVLGRPDHTQCIAQPVRQSGTWEMMPFAYSDLGDLSDAQYIGEETVAAPPGQVRARHYIVTRSLLGRFSSGRAEVWIATEGGYVVRWLAEASGTGPFQSDPQFQGQLIAHYQVSQINQPLSIVPPAACLSDLPILSDATEMSVTGNLITYKAPASMATAVAFYIREMRAQRWELIGEPVDTEGVTLMKFRRPPQTASLMLAPSAQDGLVQIVIVLITD